MNIVGGILLVLSAAYLVFLCISAIRLMRSCVLGCEPHELLKAVATTRRHHGIHAVASFASAALLGCSKALLLLTGHYENPGFLAHLALGDTSESTAAKLGLTVCLLVGLALAEAVSFVRYDAYLRMIYALRKHLNLDMQLTSDR